MWSGRAGHYTTCVDCTVQMEPDLIAYDICGALLISIIGDSNGVIITQSSTLTAIQPTHCPLIAAFDQREDES